eukprot:SAG31_NODE_5060_length_2766_cov_17.451444_1_plen_90_part_00
MARKERWLAGAARRRAAALVRGMISKPDQIFVEFAEPWLALIVDDENGLDHRGCSAVVRVSACFSTSRELLLPSEWLANYLRSRPMCAS